MKRRRVSKAKTKGSGRRMDPSTKIAVAATALGMCVGAALSKDPGANRSGVRAPAAKSAPSAPAARPTRSRS